MSMVYSRIFIFLNIFVYLKEKFLQIFLHIFLFLFKFSKFINYFIHKEVYIISNLLNPKNDYVFHRIFGHSGNEDITKNFLSSIIPDTIHEITLDCNPITESNLLDDKVGILDIKAKLNNNVNCNIEMQMVNQSHIVERLLFIGARCILVVYILVINMQIYREV